MKIRVMSDLHLEFSRQSFDHLWDEHPDDAETTMVLAGDISTGMLGTKFVDVLCKHFKNVVMVCGNHEFYYHSFEEVIAGWTEYESNGSDNFHFLNNATRIVDGVRFIGGTMWTGLDNNNSIIRATAVREMNDYAEITYNGKPITADFVVEQHAKFIKFLTAEFDNKFDGKTVVVTHHSPGNCLRRTGYAPWGIDHCYYADIETLVGNADVADLWCHGHKHKTEDYMINNTRVIANPFGYCNYETNYYFNKQLTIEI